MTSNGSGDGSPPSPVAEHQVVEDGPFILRPLLNDVQLSADGTQTDIKINCVDYWNNNLYVGTSASEILHYVQIPPDPADETSSATYILASRLAPDFAESSAPNPRPGVQQILLLPLVGKACVLCNRSATFYSLPELSPVLHLVKNCNWIGGTDLNEPPVEGSGNAGDNTTATILMSVGRQLTLLAIGENARYLRKINYPGTTRFARRDTIACVADSNAYSLLDVDRQLKIPLMNISSLTESPPSEMGQTQNLGLESSGGISRSASAAHARPQAVAQSHARSTSLGAPSQLQQAAGTHAADPEGPASGQGSRSVSPQPPADGQPALDKPLPEAPATRPGSSAAPVPELLRPHVVSPSPEEFLLVTGTTPNERGIGMFVNLDGDPPTRPTLDFERYPFDLAVDGSSADSTSPDDHLLSQDVGYVLASMAREVDNSISYGLEIQQWDTSGETDAKKFWLEAPGIANNPEEYGLRSLTGSEETRLDDVVDLLCEKRFLPFTGSVENSTLSLKSVDSRTALSMERLSKEKELFERDYDSQDDDSLPDGWEATRISEGKEFARQFAMAKARLAVWCSGRLWWAIRNPLICRLDAGLEAACSSGKVDRRAIFETLAPIRGRNGESDVLQFLTLGFIRQKAGLLLLTSLRTSTGGSELSDSEMAALEEVLVESKLDPRVVLSLIPGVRNEIVEGQQGIWLYGGVKTAADAYLRNEDLNKKGQTDIISLGESTLQFLRRFLSSWRKMKGFGSVRDEREVFRSVDAALLLVLLELDKHSSTAGVNRGSAVRMELNELVDKGVDCFDRAVDLLESYHRLFVLSRLYQCRKMAGDVLATWRRIIEGERDDGGEFQDGEQRVRQYLSKISNQSLVQEYGIWLAIRNPKLGVQVFADDKGKTRFETSQAVELLRTEAPGAVKDYLEHLVFAKGHASYVNELIAYYLDIVLGDLQSSAESRERIMATYDAYRALQAPKPTYNHFLTDNTPEDDEVWQSRLRLLQLLGGHHNYDTSTIRKRITALSDDLLVPETIILSGRERHHEDALRLLVHKLGDYDTAISYCLRGGSSIYMSRPGHRDSMPSVDQQRRLFHTVLQAFLAIEDVSDRVEQTGALLERFGRWFEIDDVLALIPDDWSVDVVAGFLVGALRRLVAERHRLMVTRALRGAENLRISYDVVTTIDGKGPSIEASN